MLEGVLPRRPPTLTLALPLLLVFCSAAVAEGADLFTILRTGDLGALQRSLAAGADANSADSRGTTALHYAALYSSPEAMTLLIEAGARVNAANRAGVTPLFTALGDLAKVRLLVEKGADVDAKAADGRSPVRNAASLPSGAPVVEYLLSKGAKPDTATLSGAIARGNLPLAQRLIAAGVIPSPTAYISAAGSGVPALLRLVLDQTKVLGSPDPQSQRTALMNAAYFGPAASVELLLDREAEVDAKDNRGHTALMHAAGSDLSEPAIIKLLLQKGADPTLKNQRGDTALALARRRGDKAKIAALGAEPETAEDSPQPDAQQLPSVRSSVERALRLFDIAAPGFFKANACISCHHQSIPQMATAKARAAGIAPDEQAAKARGKSVLAIWAGELDRMWQTSCAVGGGATATMTYGLVGLGAEQQPADSVIDAVVNCLTTAQGPNGSWSLNDVRQPLGMDTVKYTALAIRALQLYPLPGRRDEFKARIKRAREFLLSASPRETQAIAFQVLGLKWAGADSAAIRKAAGKLAASQRADGGWPQLSSMQSDAYATGQAMWALYEGAGVPKTDTAWLRGARFLRTTQQVDGSWHVRSRGFGFQPYRETGFPHGHDQWISSAATGFAVMALAPLIEPAAPIAARAGALAE